MRVFGFLLLVALWAVASALYSAADADIHQPLSKIAIHRTLVELHDKAYIKADPQVLGLQGQTSEWVTVKFYHPNVSSDDWIGVFSPAISSASLISAENPKVIQPLLSSAPIKYQFANYTGHYLKNGAGRLKFRLIKQRSNFSFALFSGGLSSPKLVGVSNTIAFDNPNAPVYPRLAQGKSWDEMTITWTSGYGLDEAEPVVEWGREGKEKTTSPAGTLTFDRNSMCDAPARTVGWRDPGFIHTSFLKDLWPNAVYTYRVGHVSPKGKHFWSQEYKFKASPFPGQDSLQRVLIFGDMGKAEVDGSNEYNDYQSASLNTTAQIVKDLDNIDIVFHNGDITYANGYISQWDQFTEQVEAKFKQTLHDIKWKP